MRTSVHHTMDDRGAIRLCAESLKGQKDMGTRGLRALQLWFVSVLQHSRSKFPRQRLSKRIRYCRTDCREHRQAR